MSESAGTGMEPTLVTARWSLVQFTLLSCYTVGFHGVISFPYYVHKHSGLFLVAFYLLMVLICIPVCYVQIKLGALFKRGIVGIFGILVPLLKGSAVSILVLTYIRCLLHGVELSYALYFAFASLQSPFPWAADKDENGTISELRLHHRPADKFFHVDFLQKSEHIGEGGYIVWYIALCLIATWLAVYFLTFKGTALISKIAYILTPVTMGTLLIVMIYGYSTIPDAPTAVMRLLSSKGEAPESADYFFGNIVNYKLGHPGPWIDALNLHMNSLGLWAGVLPTLGTLVYNRKYVVNASWILLLLVYSILPQIALFSLAPYINPSDSGGYIAASNGIKPGLPFLFIAIPTSFERLELSPVIAFCLFICIFLFGLHHQAIHLIAIWENLLPSTPKFLMSYFRRREILVAAVCMISFLLSISYALQGGIYLYVIVNNYVDRLIYTLIVVSTIPFLVGYIKQEVLYIPIERAFMSLWYGIAALISAVLLVYFYVAYVYTSSVVGYEQRWANKLGWTISVVPVLLGIILGAIHAIHKQKGSLKQRFVQSLRSESFNAGESSIEYTTNDTGDTVLQNPSTVEEPVYEKTETEVFIQPAEEFDPTNV
ncbi:hypothetical protein ACF0H5_009287 [Mactra antiquata]